MNWDKYIFNRLCIAIPEFQIDDTFLRFARSIGAINAQDEAAYLEAARRVKQTKKVSELARKLKGKSLVQTILILEPELLSVRTVNFLRRANLISVTEGNALKAAFKGANLLVPALTSDVTLATRLGALFGSTTSSEMINLIRNLDNARINELRSLLLGDRSRLTSFDATLIRSMLIQSIERAQAMRSAIALAESGVNTYTDVTRAKNVWNAITVLGNFVLSDEVLRNAIRVGIIPRDRYVLIKALEELGLSAWTRSLNAFKYESWYARGLMLSEGVLSTEMIEALRASGLISNELARRLNPAAQIIRGITRTQADKYRPGRQIRVIPGESPIKTFSRATNKTDQAIIKLLAEASEDSRKDIERLLDKKNISAKARRAQQSVVRKAIHRNMHLLWENVGYLIIHGEKEAAIAAVESSIFLQKELWGKGGKDFERMIIAQSRAGLDSFISRSENTLPLSARVYKNMGLSRTRVAREVNKALLRGLSARDVAKIAAQFIEPNVRGGVSYAAMRLARTETNNAFHWTQIRHTREMPWVRGYQWHLSGSHPEPDICNSMAEKNHDGLGRGIYKKVNVPGKPHPHCFCFITSVTDSTGVFEKGLRSGKYNIYLKKMERDGPFEDEYTRDLKSFTSDVVRSTTEVGGRIAATKILGSVVQTVL
jgi:hypothetical protein